MVLHENPQEIPSQADRSSISGGARFSGAPSLDNSAYGNTHPIRAWSAPQTLNCPNAFLFLEKCGHGNSRWRKVPCRQWSCNPCHLWRVSRELVPEIVAAMRWGQEIGQTVKFLTLTWSRETPGCQPTEEGARRRRLDLQHLVQYFRRNYGLCEYLRVSESHKDGYIHVHLVVLMPFVHQREISRQWQIYAKSRIVFISPLFITCQNPSCKVRPVGRKLRQVSPPPGTSQCRNCGWVPDWSDDVTWLEVGYRAASYVGKYLSKDLSESGITRNLNRTRAWNQRCRPEQLEYHGKCGECETHEFELSGSVARLVREGYSLLADGVTTTGLVAFYSQARCECWPAVVWRESPPMMMQALLPDRPPPVRDEAGLQRQLAHIRRGASRW